MRTFYYYATILALLLCLTSCVSGDKKPSGDLLTFDVEAAIDNPRTFSLEEMAGKVEIIPLDDTSLESLIGRTGKIVESKTGFYIVDRSNINSPAVKFFDKTGKFVSQKGTVGRGPGEYQSLSDIAVDYEKDNLYILARDKILAYDASGKMFARADSIETGGRRISYHDGQLILLYEFSFTPPGQGDKYTLAKIFSSDLRLEGSIETDWKGDNAFSDGTPMTITSTRKNMDVEHILSNNGKTLFVKEGRSDTVFRYENDRTLEPAFKLDMGKYAIPPDPDDENRMSYYTVHDISEIGNRIAVWVRSPGFGIINTGILVFNKDNPSEGFSIVNSEGRNGLFLDGFSLFQAYSRGNRFVFSLNALSICRNRDGITNPAFKAIAESITEDSNPVLVVVTLD